MEHHFDVDLASEIGVNAAVLFHNINFWCEKNKANNKHYYEGRFWTYNSVKAFATLFPYLTPKAISEGLKKLEEAGLIISGSFNRSAYDRTKWYSLSAQGNSIIRKGKMELPKKENGVTEKGKSIYRKGKIDLPKRANLYLIKNLIVNLIKNLSYLFAPLQLRSRALKVRKKIKPPN